MLAERIGLSVIFRCVSNYAHPTPHKSLAWGTNFGHLECVCRDLSRNRFYGPLPTAPHLLGKPPQFLYDLGYNHFSGIPDIHFVRKNRSLALCDLLTASRARQAVATIDAPLEGLGLTNTISYNCLHFPSTLSACAKKFPQRSNGACARFGRRKQILEWSRRLVDGSYFYDSSVCSIVRKLKCMSIDSMEQEDMYLFGYHHRENWVRHC